MDELYYEDGQVPDLASSGFTFSDEVIAKALVGIYKGEVDIDKGVEQNLYKETLRILNKATAKGIADAIDGGAPAPKKDFLYQLRHSNEVFSAFKTHTQQNHLADLLTDSKGKLKPFGQFAKDSEAVIGKYNRQWLRTEYDTAVIRAHQAANWQKFEEEKDVLPNLEWIPSTSPNPSEDHMVFWGTILPVDDGFWDAHRPGDRWNCKCDLRSTDKAATHAPDADIISKHDEPAKGLDNNPGKDGKIFNQSHPYFPKSCAACPFSSNGKPSPLADNIIGDCNNCGNVEITERIRTNTEVPPCVEEYEKIYEGVYAHPLHDGTEREENLRIAKILHEKLKQNIYLCPELDPKKPGRGELRSRLLPFAVSDTKSPDFFIAGKSYDAKKYKPKDPRADDKAQTNGVASRIKKAKEQAENVVLEIDGIVRRENIHSAILNFLRQSHHNRTILVLWKGELLVYGGKQNSNQ